MADRFMKPSETAASERRLAGDLAARHSGNQAGMTLRCEECGSATELARGWRAKIVDDEEQPEMMPTSSATAPPALSASSGSPSRATGTKTASPRNELLRAVVARCSGANSYGRRPMRLRGQRGGVSSRQAVAALLDDQLPLHAGRAVTVD